MKITIASMNAAGAISDQTRAAAETAERVVLQTMLPGNETTLPVPYETLDELYHSAADFDDLVIRACEFLEKDGTLFVVLGDIFINEIAVNAAQRIIADGGSVRVVDGGDRALSVAFEADLIKNVSGICTHTASSFTAASDTDTLLVIHEIDSRIKASEIKLNLVRYYGDEHHIMIVNVRDMTGRVIPLCEVDQNDGYGYHTSIVVPPLPLEKKLRYTFADLVTVMDRLRGINGCPWDREQTHASLKRYLVEESYEVLEAIDDGDMDALYDELGDVLLQVVFHAKIAQQSSEFDIADVTTAICKKMISRHTHIFGNAVADTPDAVIQNWEQIKRKEKDQKTQTQVLKNVPKSMPALMRSGKVQHKAAHIGFDFRDVSEAFDKLREEISEVVQDIENGKDLWEECGDLLFAAVNVVRMLKVEPEVALQKATDKFISRFSFVEQIAIAKKVDMNTCTIEELDLIWDEAKKKINK